MDYTRPRAYISYIFLSRIMTQLNNFFLEHGTMQTLTNTHVHSTKNVHTPYLYEHLRRTEPADLEVDEVSTGVSMLTGTSPTSAG